MNKILSFARRLSPPYVDRVEGEVDEPRPDTPIADIALLSQIYGVDPNSGVPTGDLAIYLGDNANPTVKQYIEQNLLKEHQLPSATSMPEEVLNKFRTEMKDDDVAFFSRNHNESREEFADRIKLFLYSEKKRIAQDKRNKEIQKSLDEASKRNG